MFYQGLTTFSKYWIKCSVILVLFGYYLFQVFSTETILIGLVLLLVLVNKNSDAMWTKGLNTSYSANEKKTQ